ncbi:MULTISPECIES: amino acid adenylation domain-containing protein [unclassified Streptomyces]|uniref:amino acid adenylation domain-containing protein n=1 Tax=unclassified Streptomyces TaxID=2593676 RepID=UPI0008816C45|nr:MULTISPECIES: amino acid adenylation domain-containing protein [unclassified Streptomyces]PBC84316.1 L-prolyl-[peptidyl carrier protein] synthetase [Streptomyces sp. 2321.6]SDR32438.1 L-prolyl-[peptidyl carrier protein] synthetase [Streptomyces sp. KS_16]SED27096.1 L-prolyl-[peptidyl carrier protein] synthetase [Streptomyces sp. 2133.1]SEE56352.1 L-prolyl-[peptidyl carrier protein] synthetase [Streptomyces sp. 2112.3]SNC70398.1 amino acid adenylation domain-containing protein [Streptomyces 
MAAGRSLADDLRATAARHGDRTAVIDGTTTLSYAELDGIAEHLAQALRARGVTPGDCVVWHGAKSSLAVAAVHGILRSRAGYVPIDPDGPIARAELIAGRCLPRAMVADAGARDQWRTVAPGLVWEKLPLGPEPVGELWCAVPTDAPRAPLDDLAYVLHTSGSTGLPKGVVHTHASASAFVDWSVQELGLTERDVIINSAPLHFDPTTLHLFGAARTGAAVALMPASAAPFPAAHIDFCRQVGGTVWYAVTSTLAWLTRRGKELLPELRGLRAAVVGGEVLPPDEVNVLLSALPGIRLLNVYGPTESNVCTFHEIRGPQQPDAVIPIGRVLPGAEIAVVDERLERVEPGCPGQLLVRGAMLMEGYLDPEQTARAFVRTADDRRWYASGDLVRENSAGELEFIGREDAQIKSRGFRVELGEIERHLHSLDGVHECVAVATPDAVFSNVITAFVTADHLDDVKPLPDVLRARLPHYMVPERLVLVADELPRNSNGKVDRKALSELAARPELDDTPGLTVVH